VKEKVVLAWSGGKDSAMALHALLTSSQYNVVSLLTTISEQYDRISHHGVRVELLEQQAAALGICLHKLYLHQTNCNIADYEAAMKKVMLEYKEKDVITVAFGDVFLQDLREYREYNLAKVGMKGIFPIWRRDTTEIVQTFIDLGFKAYLTCVDGEKLGREFAGRPIDVDFIRDLPDGVDPCGENGEFHSYIYDGPIFQRPVGVSVGEVVLRDVRYFTDLVPAKKTNKETSLRQ
jgi:uncharacterized protein (TIGR00290 family)